MKNIQKQIFDRASKWINGYNREIVPIAKGDGSYKQPMTKWKTQRLRDTKQLESFIESNPSMTGYGVILGDGIICIDVDQHNEKADGIESLKAWEKENGELPSTYTELTPGGGLHYFYLVDGDYKRNANMLPGVDILGSGYAIVAPSMGRNKPYSCNDKEIAKANDIVYKLIESSKIEPYKGNQDTTKRDDSEELENIHTGERTNFLVRQIAKMKDGSFDDETIKLAIRSLNSKIPEPLTDKELETEVLTAIDNMENHAEKNIDMPYTPQNEDEYLNSSVAHHLQDFINFINDSKNTPCYSTGLESVDEKLDGGIYNGLYFVGAISSLGKTTFCLQIANEIARQGADVIIFTLEMSEFELDAKAISRLTLLKDMELNHSTSHAKTARGIMTGKRYESYSEMDNKIIKEAFNAYESYTDHIFIREGIGNIDVYNIIDQVNQHIKVTGNKPVVLIDYVQILKHNTTGKTEKQNTDDDVLELKRLSRDAHIPVIAISSFNRANYNEPVNMASFKESGAIEYTSDVLIGLQYEGMDYLIDENDRERKIRINDLVANNERKALNGDFQNIEVKVLKNRFGTKGSAYIDFCPMFNHFDELHDKAEQREPRHNKKTSPREAKRKKLKTAFEVLATLQGKESTTLLELADYMDMTKKQVKNAIEDLGEFEIDKDENVKRKVNNE